MNVSMGIIRQHIQEMPPYEPIFPLEVLSKELGIPVKNLVKLDANENPYGPLPEVKKALSEMETLHIYPDPESRRIKNILATHHGIREESIVIGAGADELIDLIMRLVVEPGDVVLNCPPTFGMYGFDGELNKAQLEIVPRRSDYSLDISKINQAVRDHHPKLLFLANPNNPDGSLISDKQFKQLLELPLLLVIDEAYIQFSDQGRTYLNEVCNFTNLIVLRTFSKWAGLAGLRIGYGIFPEEIVPDLMRAKQPYNVSVAAEEAAVITMNHLPQAKRKIAKIIEGRAYLYSELLQIPWLKPYPSQANFILCQVEGYSARDVKQHLRNQGQQEQV